MTTPEGRMPGSRIVRDRFTLSLYGPFIVWGWFLYGFSPAVPLITTELEISRAEAGLHGTAMAVGSVASGLISARIAARYGRRFQSLLGLALVVAGVGGLLVGTVLAATLTAVLVAALGGNLLLSAVQPALSAHHGGAGPAVLTESNGIGAAFGLLAPVTVGLTVGAGWGWRPAVAVVIVIALAGAALIARIRATGALGRTAVVVHHDDAAEPVRGFDPVFWLFFVGLLAGVSLEFSTTFWAADLVLSRTSASPGVATASVSALVAGMATARFVVGPMSLRRSPEKLLLVGFALAAAGWVVMWTATSPVPAVVGLVIMGLGYGTHYPLGIAMVMRSSRGRLDSAQAVATIGGGVAIGIAPFLLGALADAFGAHRAFILVPVLAVVGGIAVAVALVRTQGRRSLVPTWNR